MSIDMSKCNRVSGFTLIELVVVMAVAAISLAVAVPAFSSLSLNARLSDITSDLVATLNYARSEAIRRNQTVYVCALNAKSNLDVQGCLSSKIAGSNNYSWGEGILAYADLQAKNTPAAYSSGEKVRHALFKQDVSVQLPAKQLAFSAEGRLQDGSSYRFVFRDNASQECRTIRLSGSGRARLCDKGETGCDIC
ncbi:GspH/FimT family pseudopilin [Crenobacter cavernae]|uniref:GspH/FimT family pseudopilin n=1 Tax=Crenobacter cavernae TaxID=2290923 RepID=UPI0015F14C33|nr:GspH/FimT family pseudopilin [Crenobacter cavernae]